MGQSIGLKRAKGSLALTVGSLLWSRDGGLAAPVQAAQACKDGQAAAAGGEATPGGDRGRRCRQCIPRTISRTLHKGGDPHHIKEEQGYAGIFSDKRGYTLCHITLE